MYASAQIALRETLSQVHAPPPPEQRALPLLANAVVESVEIAPGSPGAGKLIRELGLRTRTGASAVGIERDGTSVINPGPDEELLVGDRVLLLGDRAQLDAARDLLTARGGASSPVGIG
jgi:CPA2 family monovalent cation:H+ antiporter-2